MTLNGVNSTLVLFGLTIFGGMIELVAFGLLGHVAYVIRFDFVKVERFGAVTSGT